MSFAFSHAASSEAPDAPVQVLLRRPVLTREQELAFSKAALAGDRDARWELALGNARFAYKTAKDYTGRGVSHEDLFAVALFAMYEVADRYDATRGHFIGWAKMKMTTRLQEAVAEFGRALWLPRTVDQACRRARAMDDAVSLDRDELSERLNVGRKTARHLLSLVGGMIHLEAPMFGDEGSASIGAAIADPGAARPSDETEQVERSHEIEKLLGCLTPRERSVIAARFGLAGNGCRTLDDVGRALRLTRERIRQIEFRALRKMRRAAGSTLHAFESEIVSKLAA